MWNICRSKESGAYESDYLDQTPCQYGYLNGQDPSSSQDQRRKHSYTPISILFLFEILQNQNFSLDF